MERSQKKVIKVKPAEGYPDQAKHDLKYYVFLTKSVECVAKYVIPLCYVIFTITYLIIFF